MYTIHNTTAEYYDIKRKQYIYIYNVFYKNAQTVTKLITNIFQSLRNSGEARLSA